jgi:hypothetical protein
MDKGLTDLVPVARLACLTMGCPKHIAKCFQHVSKVVQNAKKREESAKKECPQYAASRENNACLPVKKRQVLLCCSRIGQQLTLRVAPSHDRDQS